ncbi:MAG: prolyl-tRNA synthetase associated domain-containing protein [Pseudomonadota bacterium]
METEAPELEPPLPTTPDALLDQLSAWGIAQTTHHHQPVFTVDEAKDLRGQLSGGHCKSLFLKNKKGAMWLVVCDEDRRIDLKALSSLLQGGRLSFGSADRLRRVLGVLPGSVTPFALINDGDHQVTPVLDKTMLAHDRLNYHPLVNTMTTTIASADLVRFVEACGHRPVILDLDAAAPTP